VTMTASKKTKTKTKAKTKTKTAATAGARKPGTDWRRRFDVAKPPKVVELESDFAGIRAGTKMLVGSPALIAAYVRKIPFGQTRSIERLRNDLARRHGATATCPVTTAIFLRVVAELAWQDLQAGRPPAEVTPFWRVVEPGSPLAKRLSCDSRWLEEQRATERD
jgi:hypothetical protein